MQRKNVHPYAAIFDPAKEGGYNVSFPAFPGCVTFGKDLKEAKKNAKEVLELWIEELEPVSKVALIRRNSVK
jgi:predicted RNase H-like HicB family nuclease